MTQPKRGRPPARKAAQKVERFEQVSQNFTERKRIPLKAQIKLGFPASVEKEGDMYYCWVLDDGKGNIKRYEDAGYDFALSTSGNREERDSGGGEPLLLMKTRKDWRDEDYAIEQSMCLDTVKDKARLAAHEYVPKGHDAVVSKNI